MERTSGSPRLAIAVTAIACGIALGACGSSAKPATTGGSNGNASFLNFSKCMRSHGVPNFPDPSTNGGGVKIAITPGSGLSPQSPAFQSAQQSCHKLLPGGGPPAQVPESVKLSALKFAQCMRAHGLRNYPDPTFQAGDGVERPLPPGMTLSSPAFQSASKACGGG